MEDEETIELRCDYALHGIVFRGGAIESPGSILEVRCPDCARREQGMIITHRWQLPAVRRLDDRREIRGVAA